MGKTSPAPAWTPNVIGMHRLGAPPERRIDRIVALTYARKPPATIGVGMADVITHAPAQPDRLAGHLRERAHFRFFAGIKLPVAPPHRPRGNRHCAERSSLETVRLIIRDTAAPGANARLSCLLEECTSPPVTEHRRDAYASRFGEAGELLSVP